MVIYDIQNNFEFYNNYNLETNSYLSWLFLGSIACAFVVSAAIGESIIPLMVGELFDHHGTIVFMVCAVILCALAGVTFAILRVITVKWYQMEDPPKSFEGIHHILSRI